MVDDPAELADRGGCNPIPASPRMRPRSPRGQATSWRGGAASETSRAVHLAAARHCPHGVTWRLSRGGKQAYCRRNERLNLALPRRRSKVTAGYLSSDQPTEKSSSPAVTVKPDSGENSGVPTCPAWPTLDHAVAARLRPSARFRVAK